jgi:hypothetical protein
MSSMARILDVECLLTTVAKSEGAMPVPAWSGEGSNGWGAGPDSPSSMTSIASRP